MYEKAATTGIAALQQAGKMLAGVREGADSLVGFTQVARVEPLCLIDSSLIFNDNMPDVMQTISSIFSGYYLQAFALSVNVGNIDVVKHLEKLNPSRSGTSAVVGQVFGETLGMESYYDFDDRLPVPGDERNQEPTARIALEDALSTTGVRDASDEIRTLHNLAVGKMLNIEVQDGSHKAVIPVSVRLMANSVTPKSLVHIFTVGSKDVTFAERIHQWRSGEIELFRDLIWNQDLVDAHKQHLMEDKDNILQAVLGRRTNNAIASIVTGNFSVATASNIVVLSADTKTDLELALSARLSDYKARQKVFEKTYLMLMVIVDTDRDRVTIYHRGIPEGTSLSMRDLKAGNKGNGPDVSDILAAYRVGAAPSL